MNKNKITISRKTLIITKQ